MDKSIKKSIISSSLITFGIIAIVVYVTLLVVSLCFPIVIANLSMQVGNEKLASIYYNLDYDKTGDLNSIYKAVNISIKYGDNTKIEKYYAKMEKNKDYSDFILERNIKNSKLKISDFAKSFILNEDDYLKTKYVNALILNNKKVKAINYVIDNFRVPNPSNFDSSKLDECLKYTMTSEVNLLDTFISQDMSEEDIKIFTSTHNNKYNETLISAMFGLSNIYVSDLFNNAINNVNKENKVYVMMCGNMSIELCQDIVTVYENAQTKNIDISLTNTQYNAIKTIIDDLIIKMNNLVDG